MLESQAAAMERLPEQSQRVFPTPGQVNGQKYTRFEVFSFLTRYRCSFSDFRLNADEREIYQLRNSLPNIVMQGIQS